MRIAAIQMTSSSDHSQNLAQAHELLLESLDRKCDLVAFPEMFSLLTGDNRQLLEQAESLKGPTVETLQEWAAEHEVWILGGSLPFRKGKGSKKILNTSFLLSPEGEIAARYDKIHLFDAEIQRDQKYQESKYFDAGKKTIVAEISDLRVGMSVCFDLRFPELYREQARLGARILFIPSAFTVPTGQAHWDVLTRARAIENQCYVIAPAQVGENYPGRRTYGHTRIIDPWGRVLAERPAGPGIVWAQLNFSDQDRIRREMPVLNALRRKK